MPKNGRGRHWGDGDVPDGVGPFEMVRIMLHMTPGIPIWNTLESDRPDKEDWVES